MADFSYKNGNISYRTKGKGSAVFLLHGFLEDQSMWQEFQDFLPKKYRTITLDLPGHGQSSSFGYIHSMEFMAELVLALAKELSLKKFHIIGHSMGGYVALAIAEKNPDCIKSLSLLHSTARADSNEKKENRNKALALVRENHKSFIRHSIPILFRPKNRKVYSEEINILKKQALQSMDAIGISAALRGMKMRVSRELILKFCPFPVHIVAGVHDSAVPFEHQLEQASLQENIKLSLLENSGHMGFIEEKSETFRVLKEFLNASQKA